MIRIIIADDHPLVRRGLRELVEDASDCLLVAEAGTARDLQQLAREREWDVCLLDLNLPDGHGLDLMRSLKAWYPDRAVLILSMHAEEQYAVRALKAGASGYLTKEAAPDELLTALRRVAQGGRYVSARLAELLAADVTHAASRPHERLSDREFAVLRLIASGRSVGQIASELNLSAKTVSTYRTRILEKTGMKHNAELTRYAIENGLVG